MGKIRSNGEALFKFKQSMTYLWSNYRSVEMEYCLISTSSLCEVSHAKSPPLLDDTVNLGLTDRPSNTVGRNRLEEFIQVSDKVCKKSFMRVKREEIEEGVGCVRYEGGEDR